MQHDSMQACIPLFPHQATMPPTPPAQLIERHRHYAAGVHLFHPGEESSRQLQFIVRGRVKRYQTDQDGVGRIIDFPGPGEWLSLETIGMSKRLTGAVALTPCEIAVLSVPSLLRVLAQQARCAELFTQLLATELANTQRHTAMLRRPDATQRVTQFLLECAKRSPSLSGIEIPLPMSRDDIANYLGLTPTTVSRTLSKLNRSGWLKIGRSSFTLMDQNTTGNTGVSSPAESAHRNAQDPK